MEQKMATMVTATSMEADKTMSFLVMPDIMKIDDGTFASIDLQSSIGYLVQSTTTERMAEIL